MFTRDQQFVIAIVLGSCLLPTGMAQPRIVGGDIVQDHNAYPWQAALVYRDDSRDPPMSVLEGQFCAGTLIHSRWVLTAAHCVVNCFYNEYYLPVCQSVSNDSLDVVLGVLNLRTEESERVHVKSIVIHPDYHFEDYTSPDIALVELEKAVNRPTIGLVRQDSPLEAAGVMATVIGWGNTANLAHRPIFSDELRQVSVPIVANEVCQQAASDNQTASDGSDSSSDSENLNLFDGKTQLCTGFVEGGKNACHGDSGGPLLVPNETGTGWQQVGIVSFRMTENCAEPNAYSVYTRVSAFNDFISETVCNRNTMSFVESLFTSPIPSAPQLTLTVEGNVVTGSWPTVNKATGYELFYAPYPDGVPVQSLDVGDLTSYSTTLTSGQNFYVALRAYNGLCRGDFSNIAYFVIP